MAKSNVVLPEQLPSELGWPTYQQVQVERWLGNSRTVQQDYVAEEVPVSIVYNEVPHVVMLATPVDLEDFALGFSITEGLIESADELLTEPRIYYHGNGIEVRLKIPENRFSQIASKGRNLTGRTGCGLCGATSLEQAIHDAKPVKPSLNVTATEIIASFDEIKTHQQVNQLTGAVHAAAWVVPGAGLQHVREDVGRHNALDKLIGLLLRLGKNPATGYVLMTSRASYELVQKATSVGIGLLAAISAPTGLAIRMADESGMTLVGFARGDHYSVYTHPEHLNHTPFPTLIK